jgi:Tol biopolymer transport system component
MLQLEALEERLAPAVQVVSFSAEALTSSTGTSTSIATNLGSISDDGRFVAYVSRSTDLVEGQVDTNGADDVFLYDRVNLTTTLISRKAGAADFNTTGSGTSYTPSISGDGGWVAFVSEATDLIDGVSVNGAQVYLYEVATDTLYLVTYAAGSDTVASNGGIGTATAMPSLSYDGRYLAFISDASNLFTGYSSSFDWNSIDVPQDAFLYDRLADGEKISLISHVPGDFAKGGNEITSQVTVSRDGVAVAFTSYATNLGQEEDRFSTSPDIFLYDIASGDVTLVTRDASSTATSAVSGASQSDTDFSPPSISADGRYVVYASKATSLVADQVDPGTPITFFGFTFYLPNLDVFLYDNETQATTLVSLKAGTTATAAGGGITAASHNRPVISADGNWVAFVSPSNDLLSPSISAGGKDNVYLYEVATGVITLVSHVDGDAGSPASGDSPTISGDGSFVAYASTTTAPDIYRYDRSTGAIELFSPALNSTSPSGGVSTTPSISYDGLTIAWNSSATNLVADDNNNAIDVFIYSLASEEEAPTTISLTFDGSPTTSVPASPDTPFAILTTDVTGSEYNFSLVTGDGSDDNHWFKIENGELITKPGFPPEDQEEFRIRIRAEKAGNPGIFIEKKVQLGLIGKPTGIIPFLTKVPPSPGFHFGNLVGVGPDGRELRFALVNGEGDNDNGRFQIVQEDGGFKIKAGPDFPPEGQFSFSIRVRVSDAVYPSLTYEQSFRITLATTPTQITLPSLTIPAVPSRIAGQLGAVAEGDERPFSFSLVSGEGDDDNGYFSIDSDGQLSTTSEFPDGGRQSYHIRIRASDPDYPDLVFFEQSLTITSVQPPSNVSISRGTIPAKVGATGGEFSAQSQTEGRSYVFSLVAGEGDGDNGKFSISQDGKLQAGEGMTTASGTSFSIRVRAEDSIFGELAFEKPLSIVGLTDPTGLSLSQSEIPALANRSVGSLTPVAEGENRQFVYSLVSGLGDGDNGLFTINGEELRTAAEFDAAGKSSLSFRVRVADPDYPSVSFEKTFTVSVIHPPTDVTLSSLIVPPQANALGGSFAAVTGQSGRQYAFSLASGTGDTDNGLFTITSEGVLQASASFPDGGRVGYSIRVRAADVAYPDLAVEKQLSISTLEWMRRAGSIIFSDSDAVSTADGVSISTANVGQRDVALQANINIPAGSNRAAGLVVRYGSSGPNSFYLAEVHAPTGIGNQVRVNLYRQSQGQLTLLTRATVPAGEAAGAFRLEAVGSSLKVFLNGKLVAFASDGTLTGPGDVGLRAAGPAGSVGFTNIQYQPIQVQNATLPFSDDFSTNYSAANMEQLTREYVEQGASNFKVVQASGTVTNNSTVAVATLRGVSLTDQVVTADINVPAGTGSSVGLVARHTGPGQQNFYLAEVYARPGIGNNVDVTLYLNQGGSFTRLAGGTLAANPLTGQVTGILRFEVIGSSLKVFFGDGTSDGDRLVAFANNAALSGSGSAGMRISGAPGSSRISQLTVAAAPALSDPPTDNFAEEFTAATRGQLSDKFVEQGSSNFKVDQTTGSVTNNSTVAVATLRGASLTDQVVTATISVPTGTGSSAGVMARYSGPGEQNFYLAEVYARPGIGNNAEVTIYLNQGGRYTRLAGGTLPGDALTRLITGTLRLEAHGTSLKVFFGDGTSDGGRLVAFANNTALGGPGSVGMRISGPLGTAQVTAFTMSTIAPQEVTLPHEDGFEEATRGQLDSRYLVQDGSFQVNPGDAADDQDGRLLNNATIAIATLQGLNASDMLAKVDIAAGSLSFGSNRSVGLLGRYNGSGEGTGYLAEVYAAPGLGSSVQVNLYKRSAGGGLTRLATTTTGSNSGTFELALNGTTLSVFLGGVKLLEVTDGAYSSGSAGLRLTGAAGSVAVDNFSVTAP